MGTKPLTLLLLSIAKLQNLKAIHNSRVVLSSMTTVVINHKTTKFESNSQRKLTAEELKAGCYQSQNYKIWKQLTTTWYSIQCFHGLLSITKLQNLKATHNALLFLFEKVLVVINHKTTKFESNSQLVVIFSGKRSKLLSITKLQNLKATHNELTLHIFTVMLLSITKLQNLKAIHNPARYWQVCNLCCYQSQNYKIWKQFTTTYRSDTR